MSDTSRLSDGDAIASDMYFAIIPEWVLNLPVSANAIRVYCVLRRFADNQTGECFPSRKTVAMRARLSVSTLDRAVKELCDNGALTVSPRKNQHGDWSSNLYTVRFYPAGRGVSSPVRTPRVAGGETGALTGGERTIAIRTKLPNTVNLTEDERQFSRGHDLGMTFFRQKYPRSALEEVIVRRKPKFREGALAGYDEEEAKTHAATQALTPRRSTWHDEMQ